MYIRLRSYRMATDDDQYGSRLLLLLAISAHTYTKSPQFGRNARRRRMWPVSVCACCMCFQEAVDYLLPTCKMVLCLLFGCAHIDIKYNEMICTVCKHHCFVWREILWGGRWVNEKENERSRKCYAIVFVFVTWPFHL